MSEFDDFKNTAKKFLERYSLKNIGIYDVLDYGAEILIRRKGSQRMKDGIVYYDIGIVIE